MKPVIRKAVWACLSWRVDVYDEWYVEVRRGPISWKNQSRESPTTGGKNGLFSAGGGEGTKISLV